MNIFFILFGLPFALLLVGAIIFLIFELFMVYGIGSSPCNENREDKEEEITQLIKIITATDERYVEKETNLFLNKIGSRFIKMETRTAGTRCATRTTVIIRYLKEEIDA